ncbi:VWA domain-containing protein [Caballeronia sp. 15715]|uniref:TadE/TadG family type IV pilus assembly protein n=1 Tax=Caballeronia sp. 15715 TaxID=3391030 RepID=UPI0039E388B0
MMLTRSAKKHCDNNPARPRKSNPRQAAALVRGDDGAVAVVFAICGSMMIAAMCIALDTIDGGMTHSRMQSALDVATLSAGVDLLHFSTTTGTNLALWQQDARAYYNANMPTGYMALTMPDSGFAATVTGSPAAGETIQLSATGSLKLIAPVVLPGTSGNGSGSGSTALPTTAPLAANNTALYLPKSTLELVMVLDNTGSMNDPAAGSGNGPSKMAGLQAATTSLVQDLYAQAVSTYYVGLVPFASTVNVSGALPAAGSWMNPSFAYNTTNVGMIAKNKVAGWGGCAVEPRDANGFLYPNVYSPSDTLKFTPYYYNVPSAGLQIRSYSNQFCGKSTTSTVLGVPVTLDRDGEPNYCSGYLSNVTGTGLGIYYDQVSNSGYGTTTLTQNTDCIAQPVTFLTNNQSTLTNAINNMTAGGSTIIPEGLLWGWRMLSSTWSNDVSHGNGWISTDTSFPKPETTVGLQRVMIVLTDGENQIGAAGTIPNDLYFNGLSGVGSRSLAAPTVVRTDGTSLSNGLTDSSELHGNNPADPSSGNNAGWPDDVNTFQSAICTAIKQSGVTVYAITFGSGASNSVAQQAMQNCASPGNYYHAPDNATLNTIFQQIAGNLGVLRLTQ